MEKIIKLLKEKLAMKDITKCLPTGLYGSAKRTYKTDYFQKKCLVIEEGEELGNTYIELYDYKDYSMNEPEIYINCETPYIREMEILEDFIDYAIKSKSDMDQIKERIKKTLGENENDEARENK